MADKVGKKTGEKTKAGRDVYLTPDGERVSEKSVTIKFGEDAFVNAPSIYDGVRYTEDEVRDMLLEGKIKPTSRHASMEEAIKAAKSRSDNLMNKGGMAQQMDLFSEGGLLDEGGTKDPVSGNDIPVGSLQEEVRDDVPAMLSEGEFVMPADVVRYHGLDKMMALRDEAKMGLQRMEAMGQMGNAEEATLPDDVPFGLEDLDIAEEPREMQVGGFVPATPMFTPGGVQQSQFANYTPQYNPYQMPQYTTPDYSGYQAPQQTAVPMGPTTVPTFTKFVRPQTATYVNADGNEIQIPVGEDGTPLIPVPPGYTLKTDTPATPDPAPDPTQQQQPVTTQQKEEDPSDGREFGGGPAGLSMTESKIAVLTQLDNALPPEQRTGFGQKIADIRDKYKAPAGLASFSIIGGIGRAFKERGEINRALKDFDYDAAAAAAGLTREEYDGVVSELAGEVFTGYRNPTTGEVSGQKDPRNIFQRAGDFVSGIGKEEDFGDEFGNIADDGTMPTTTGVETARVTGEAAGKTVRQTAEEFRADEARRARLAGMPTADQLAGSDVIDERIIQTANALMARDRTITPDDAMRAAFLGETQGLDAAREYLASPKDDGIVDAAFAGSTLSRADDAAPSGVAAAIRRSQQTKPTEPVRDTRPAAVDPETDILPGEPGSDIAPTLNREEVDRQTQNYRNKGYSVSKAKEAAKNKVTADNEAKQQRRDRGETEANIAKTSAVTDRNGNPVRTSSGSVVTTGPQSEAPEPSKIVCTEMYRQTQLDDWKEAIKIWGVHQKKYLTPYHEKGYHWLFKPWVRGMRKSVILTSVGAYLAKARTQHLRHILTHGKAKDDIVGNIWCKIVHPLTYIAGRTKEWLKL